MTARDKFSFYFERASIERVQQPKSRKGNKHRFSNNVTLCVVVVIVITVVVVVRKLTVTLN